MADSVLITMPDDPREFFLAMAVSQAYVFEYIHEVHKLSRESQFSFTFRLKDDYADYEAPLKVAKEVTPQYDYTGWTELNRSEFNCFIDFDFDGAKKISRTTGKHITESLGILIGSRPRKCPIMPPPRCTEGKGVLILPWNSRESAIKVQSMIKNSHVDFTTSLYSMKEILAFDVDTTEAVIGPASVLTLMAASYNKKVIEIFSDMESYRLYNNGGATHNYQAIIGAGDQVTVKVIMDTWNVMSSLDYDEMELYHG
jgi:hypothetical protein